jgi:Fe-S-cluster-containing dehydrogenase component
MSQYAVITDLNRCTGCLACTAHCKAANGVPVGNFWIRAMRVGPTPKADGSGQYPDVDMYFLPMQCQHCENPECVNVCPTGASVKTDNGTVQIDADACIGCQACVSACPYGVRYLNEELNVVEKCTLCKELVDEGELPACVAQCGARARFFGDLDEGIDSFEGPWRPQVAGTYDEQHAVRQKIRDAVEPFEDGDLHRMTDEGNGPSHYYILRQSYGEGDRRNREWLS